MLFTLFLNMKSSGHIQSLYVQPADKRELLLDFSFTSAGELVDCLVHEHKQFDWTVVAEVGVRKGEGSANDNDCECMGSSADGEW